MRSSSSICQPSSSPSITNSSPANNSVNYTSTRDTSSIIWRYASWWSTTRKKSRTSTIKTHSRYYNSSSTNTYNTSTTINYSYSCTSSPTLSSSPPLSPNTSKTSSSPPKTYSPTNTLLTSSPISTTTNLSSASTRASTTKSWTDS